LLLDTTREDLFFLSYQKFKEKKIENLFLSNIPPCDVFEPPQSSEAMTILPLVPQLVNEAKPELKVLPHH